jgi:hypothetical protein
VETRKGVERGGGDFISFYEPPACFVCVCVCLLRALYVCVYASCVLCMCVCMPPACFVCVCVCLLRALYVCVYASCVLWLRHAPEVIEE